MEQYMLLLLQELRAMNIEVEVISLHPLGDLSDLLAKERIPARDVNYRGAGGWASMGELRRLLKTIQADGLLMIGHNLMASLALGRRWKRHRSLSIHYHHKGVKPLWQWRLIYAVSAFQFRTVVFVSDFIMKEALEIAPFLKFRARMVGSLVPLHERESETARISIRQRLGLPTQARIVGNAGWLITRKRWDVFLDVAALVLRAEPQTIFLIAGDGPESARLKQKAESLGITKNVIWLGWQKSLVDFHQVIDILLFNSDWDAQARTPLDAMSYGIPVVASILQGGTKEVLQDESVGILMETHDLETLAQWVVRFLREPEFAAKIGEQGRRRIQEYGDPAQHAVRMLESMGLKAPTLPS
jgi:glycosyltransferase involved in cell wall biosynthesis